jgi:sortase A
MPSKKSPKRKDKISQKYLILIGIIFLLLAVSIPILTYLPVFKAEISYQVQKNDPLISLSPVDEDFSVIIPKINANTKVIQDVDPFDSRIYQVALTRGIAHAKGTSTPDKPGNTFIFAHSALNWYQANQFNAVFYLLNKLEKGDEIVVYYQKEKYNYKVAETKIIKGNQVDYLSSKPNTNTLTLMTCWPPGTTINRLVVIASLL